MIGGSNTIKHPELSAELNVTAEELLHTNPRASVLMALRARRVAKQNKDAAESARAAYIAGVALSQLNRTQFAIRYLNVALENFSTLKYVQGQIEALLRLSVIYLNTHETIRADEHLHAALHLCRKHQLEALESDVLIFLAQSIHVQGGNLFDAFRLQFKALALAEHAADAQRMVQILSTLSAAYADCFEPQKALETIQRAYALLNTATPSEQRAAIAIELGLRCRSAGQMGQALKHLEEGRDIAESEQLDHLMLKALLCLGQTRAGLEEHAEAFRLYQEASLVAERLGDVEIKLETQLCSAWSALQLFGCEHGLSLAQQSLEQAHEHSEVAVYQALKQLTRIHLWCKNPSKAKEILARALDAAKHLALPNKEMSALHLLAAQTFEASGLPNEALMHQKALSLLLQKQGEQRATALHAALEFETAGRQLHGLQAEEAAPAAENHLAPVMGEFLARLGHELRTPLNAIIGFSELLLGQFYGTLNPKQVRYVESIHAGGEHLVALATDLLDLAKAEADHIELSLETFDLAPLLRECVSLLTEKASRAGIELQFGAGSLPPIIGDPVRLKQVVINLLSNALKFTPSGGTITVFAQLSPQKHGIEFGVADTGPGIPAEHQERIFEAYTQLGSTSVRREGTGLGLALAKRLIELHGGSICVSSEPNRGSIFTVFLPLQI